MKKSTMVSEEHCWKILDNNFKNKGFVHHQTETFNSFINEGIAKILTEEPPIVITTKTKEEHVFYTKYTITFSNVHVPSPSVIEEDRVLRGFCPSEARQRDLTYDSPIYVDVTTKLESNDCEPEIEKHRRIVIGRIPIMLRSSKCYLTNMTPNERIKAGESHLKDDPEDSLNQGESHLKDSLNQGESHLKDSLNQGESHLKDDPEDSLNQGESHLKDSLNQGESHLKDDPEDSLNQGESHLKDDPEDSLNQGESHLKDDPEDSLNQE